MCVCMCVCLSFYLFLVSFTSCIFIPFISTSLRIHPLLLQPPQQKKMKLKVRENKKKRKTSSWKLKRNTVSHTADPLVHISHIFEK